MTQNVWRSFKSFVFFMCCQKSHCILTLYCLNFYGKIIIKKNALIFKLRHIFNALYVNDDVEDAGAGC